MDMESAPGETAGPSAITKEILGNRLNLRIHGLLVTRGEYIYQTKTFKKKLEN